MLRNYTSFFSHTELDFFKQFHEFKNVCVCRGGGSEKRGRQDTLARVSSPLRFIYLHVLQYNDYNFFRFGMLYMSLKSEIRLQHCLFNTTG